MKDLNIQLGKLFRRIERTTGSGKMSMGILEALEGTLTIFKCPDWNCFLRHYTPLLRQIENTKPRFSLIIDGFYAVYEHALQAKKKGEPYSPKILQEEIRNIRKTYEKNQDNIIRHGISLIQNGDVILVYDLSTTVNRVLDEALRNKKKFSVIIARQAEEKTDEIIAFFLKRKIPFQVIPTYMLTSREGTITKVFTGVVTLKNTGKFITTPGLIQVISEFKIQKTPIYAFLQTAKFSLWQDSGEIHDVHIKEKMLEHNEEHLHYKFVSFSHDRIDIDLYTAIVTEEGIFTPSEVQKIFRKKLQERRKLKKTMFSLPRKGK